MPTIPAYLLPLPHGSAALVDCDLHRLSPTPAEYVLEVYAPRPLADGEFATFAHAFVAYLGDYVLATAVLRRLAWPMLVWGVLETLVLLAMQVRSLAFGPVGLPDLLVNLVVFSAGPLLLARFVVSLRRLRRAGRVAAAVLRVSVRTGGTRAAVIGDPERMRLVLDLWQHFWHLHDREQAVLEQLRREARRLGWRAAERFYAEQLAKLPAMREGAGAGAVARIGLWRRALWRFLFGPPFAPPLVVAPMPALAAPAVAGEA
jgi:hypothetical protein